MTVATLTFHLPLPGYCLLKPEEYVIFQISNIMPISKNPFFIYSIEIKWSPYSSTWLIDSINHPYKGKGNCYAWIFLTMQSLLLSAFLIQRTWTSSTFKTHYPSGHLPAKMVEHFPTDSQLNFANLFRGMELKLFSRTKLLPLKGLRGIF